MTNHNTSLFLGWLSGLVLVIGLHSCEIHLVKGIEMECDNESKEKQHKKNQAEFETSYEVVE